MKVSVKVKLFCYLCINLGVLGWSVVFCLEGASVHRSVSVCFASLVGINLDDYSVSSVASYMSGFQPLYEHLGLRPRL